MIFALGSLLLGGCAEVQVLRDRVDLLEQNNARLRDEFQKSEDKYYVINAQRLSDSDALNGRIRLLELELDEARNVRSDRERGLEDERFKLSLDLDAARNELDALKDALTQSNRLAGAAVQENAQIKAAQDTDQEYIARLESELEQERTTNQSISRNNEMSSAGLRALQEENERLRSEAGNLKDQVITLPQDEGPNGNPRPLSDAVLKNVATQLKLRLAGVEQGELIELRLDERGLRIIIPVDLAFLRSELTLAEPIKPILIEVADALVDLLPGRPIGIEGHTDNQPTIRLPFADNWGVGSARADKVRRFLTEEGGVAPGRISVVSRSFHDPLAENSTAKGQARNRRVEIVVGASGN